VDKDVSRVLWGVHCTDVGNQVHVFFNPPLEGEGRCDSVGVGCKTSIVNSEE
jgi:hypothetical protein